MMPEILDIEIPFPKSHTPELDISMGACKLALSPGDNETWVSGTYHKNDGDSLPTIDLYEDRALIQQSGRTFRGLFSNPPALKLALSRQKPFALSVQTGANEANFALGNVPLTNFALDVGAGKMVVNFDAPNPIEMEEIRIHGGAAKVDLHNLANANFKALRLEGGAGSFALDFGGELRRSAEVYLDMGMAKLSLTIPRDVAIILHAETTMGSMSLPNEMVQQGGIYYSPYAWENRDAPSITIRASVSMGSLNVAMPA